MVAENAARSLEYPYHLLYRPLYYFFHRFLSIELPYFWTVEEFLEMAADAGFSDYSFVHIPIRQRVNNPMSGISLPVWIMESIQRMTLYVLER